MDNLLSPIAGGIEGFCGNHFPIVGSDTGWCKCFGHPCIYEFSRKWVWRMYPEVFVDGQIEEGYGAPLVEDPVGDNFQQVSHLDLVDLYARQLGSSLYIAMTLGGDIYKNPWGDYLLYFDLTGDESGAPVDVARRPISIDFPYLPEFRIDIQAIDRKGTISPSLQFYAWDGAEWNEFTFTGGVAVESGNLSVIELQIPLIAIGNPEFLYLGAVSTGRGRVHSAGDILGNASSISDWGEEVIIGDFFKLELEYSE